MPSVALVTSDRALLRQLSRTVASLGFTAHPCPFDRPSIHQHLKHPCNICIVDGAANLTDLVWLYGELAAHPPIQTILLQTERTDPSLVVDLLERRHTSHIIGRRSTVSTDDSFVGHMPASLIDEQELAVVCRKIASGDIFGLGKHLFTWGIRVNHQRLHSIAQKGTALGEIERFLSRLDCHQTIVPAISLVLDELLMNAFFNAPCDDAGRPLFVHIDRHRIVELPGSHRIDVSWACDGRYVGLAVSDPFGTLTRETIIKYLRLALLDRPAEAENKEQGAGLGLYMAFSQANHLVFNLSPGERTEVVALFYVRDGGRAFRASGRCLHIFETA